MKDVIAILNDIRPGQDFSGASDFFGQGVLDSLDLIALVSALEARYNMFVDVQEMVPDNFRSLAAIQALLARHGVSL
ncbi:MAG: phosphopantetheine-binding protein [Candidatus Acidiferrales bacterium]|jgi:acyl carrier protein